MKNKKIIIIISIALIIALVVITFIITRNKSKEVNIASNNGIVNEIENTNDIQSTTENTIENSTTNIVEDNNNIQESAIEEIEEQKTQIAKETEEKKVVQATNNKETQEADTKTQKSVTSTTKETKKTQQKTKEESPKKQEQTQTISQNNSYTETEVKVAEKTECVGNNHKMSSGNTGKWFSTKAQAENYYENEIEKWGKKWENDEIEKSEYLKNCPSGYEVWTCPQCGKWTINFYYR